MFTSLDASLIRERNAELLREVQAERLGKRTVRGRRPGWRRTVGGLVARGLAGPSARPGPAGGKGAMPEKV